MMCQYILGAVLCVIAWTAALTLIIALEIMDRK